MGQLSDNERNQQKVLSASIGRLEGYQKTTPALQKHMTPLTTSKVLTLQDCRGLTWNRPGTAGPFPGQF